METIVITCGACRQDFPFRHPSVRSAADMARVTIDCTHCGTALTAAPNHIVMQPLQLTEFMERRLAQITKGVDKPHRYGGHRDDRADHHPHIIEFKSTRG